MTCTLLPLDIFRDQIGYSPFHFWQLASNDAAPVTAGCNDLMRQYNWQNVDAVGRHEITEYIKTAEDRLKDYLNYSVAPEYVANEAKGSFCFQHNCYPKLIKVDSGNLLSIGEETWSEIGQANLVYYDSDGDGINDLWTCTFADTATDPADIAIHFTQADRLEAYTDSDYSDCQYQIRPVNVTRLDANTLQARGRAWLMVRPQMYEGSKYSPGSNPNQFGVDSSGAIDPTDPNNFVSQVSFFKRTITNSNQAALIYNSGSGTLQTFQLTATIYDSDTGTVLLTPQAGGMPCSCGMDWFGTAILPGYMGMGLWYARDGIQRPAAQIQISYRAGAYLKSWQTIVTRLALAEMRRPICACERANQEVFYWQEDLARAGGAMEEQFRIGDKALNNYLGTRRGQVYAWNRIKNLQLVRGVVGY